MKLPAIIRYTDNLPENLGGQVKFFFVFIRPKYKDDAGLLQHEMEHIRQFWTAWAASAAVGIVMAVFTTPLIILFGLVGGLFTHQAAYAKSRAYRLWCEARAYAKQVAPDRSSDLSVMAERLTASSYNLNISTDYAAVEITKHL